MLKHIVFMGFTFVFCYMMLNTPEVRMKVNEARAQAEQPELTSEQEEARQAAEEAAEWQHIIDKANKVCENPRIKAIVVADDVDVTCQ